VENVQHFAQRLSPETGFCQSLDLDHVSIPSGPTTAAAIFQSLQEATVYWEHLLLGVAFFSSTLWINVNKSLAN
jgi:hypothetical protein